MSDSNLHPYIYTQEITLHIRVSRKFHFLSQLRSVIGIKALQEVLASPHPCHSPYLTKMSSVEGLHMCTLMNMFVPYLHGKQLKLEE